MTSKLSVVMVPCRDPEPLADFWCAVLGYARGNDGTGWVAIEHPDDGEAPIMAFVAGPVDRAGKNRLHVDISPTDATQKEEVERLVGLGARFTGIGPGGDAMLVVMTDPEGNEFCVTPGTERGATEPSG